MRTRYLATFIVALLVACGAGAQERNQRRGGGRRDGKGFVEGATLLYIQTLIQNLDADKNSTVEEAELEKGFLAMLEQHEERYKMLLQLFDKDKDGALNKQESQAARTFVFGLAALLRYDQNQDWKVDDPESDKAWEQLGEQSQRHNEGTLRKFDKDKDGELSPEETEGARKEMREWQKRGRK